MIFFLIKQILNLSKFYTCLVYIAVKYIQRLIFNTIIKFNSQKAFRNKQKSSYEQYYYKASQLNGLYSCCLCSVAMCCPGG